MKFTLLIPFATLAISSSAESAIRGGTSTSFDSIDIEPSTVVYAAPVRSYGGQSSKDLWDEIALHASFMQEEIRLGRTEEECIEDCDITKEQNSDFNRARCQRDCESLDNSGRSGSCRDCNQFNEGSNSYERCWESCETGNAQRCLDARTCDDCEAYCAKGSERDSCYRDVDPNRRCGSGGGNNNRITNRDIRNACGEVKNCNGCKKQCPNGDIKDACKDKECNSEDWLEDEFEEAVSE